MSSTLLSHYTNDLTLLFGLVASFIKIVAGRSDTSSYLQESTDNQQVQSLFKLSYREFDTICFLLLLITPCQTLLLWLCIVGGQLVFLLSNNILIIIFRLLKYHSHVCIRMTNTYNMVSTQPLTSRALLGSAGLLISGLGFVPVL